MKKLSEKIKEIEIVNNEEKNDYANNCHVCKNNIKSGYNWFVVIDNSDNKKLTLCSLDCLKRFSKKKINLDKNYRLVGYSRCAAYFNCKEIDNLRGKCLRRHEFPESEDLTIFNPINFCEPSEAGIIMASCKINKTLNEFSKESTKQYKITAWMTLLVIILTILNLYIAMKSFYDNSIRKQIKILEQINKNISEGKTDIIDLIKDR